MNTIKSEIITITPEIAKLWLTIYNKRNRKLNKACLIPAIIRMVADYGWDKTWDRAMSSIEVKSIIYMDYNSWIAAAEASEEMKTTCVPSVWGAFYYMALKQWPESIKLFHNRISKMTNISDGSPVIALNKVLMQFKGKTRKDNGKTRADKIQMIEKCIIAFNAHLQNQKLYRITLGKKRAEILK